MKKKGFVVLFAIAFFLFGCREEFDNVHNENSYQLKKDEVKTQILHKQDYESRNFLKPSIKRIENFLNTNYSGNSSISKSTEPIGDYEIYTDTFEEVSYRDARYSSFYIIRDQKDGFEEKLVLKSINNQVTEKYILKYKRLPDYSIDPTTYQTLKLEEKTNNDGASLIINLEIFKMGCSKYIVTKYDCGEGGHHNGMTCPTSGEWVPHNVVTVTFDVNCTSNSDTGAGAEVPENSPNTGGSNGSVPSGDTPAVITLPSSAPLYIIQRPRGVICNPLDLNTDEINQFNSNDNVKLRIYQYLVMNGYDPAVCNDLPINIELQVLVKALINYTKDNPTVDFNDLNFSFLNSVYQFLQDEYDDIDNPLEIFHRVKALDNALAQNPNLLLDIPCGELPKWQELANHPIPQSVKNKIFQVNGLTGWFKEAVIQNLDYSNSFTINMDVYPVKISSMPEKSPGVKYTHAEFFDYFRKNINNFTDINHGKFYPVVTPDYNIDDAELWNSNNPLGSLITIKIPADNGTVVCSGWGSQAWIFTTVKSPWDGEHPVSGNRLFGYFVDDYGDMVIYTRGVDRFTTKFSNNAIQYTAEGFGYSEAKKMWKDMQQKVSSFVNSKNGNSSVIEGTDYTPNFIFVKDYLKNKKPISALGCH